MIINRIKESKIHNIDFGNLPFGKVFSDHMLICQYKSGKWHTPEIRPYGTLSISAGTQVLHYGQSVFEGMKAFKSDAGELLLFRYMDNYRRLNQSATRLSIPEISENIFKTGLKELLNLDSDWCNKEDGYALYIRPFIFASGECIKASASTEYTFVIITSPSTVYYPKAIDVIIEEHYSRASRGGVGFAKAAGNYASSFYPTKQANRKGFTQIIWTDAKEHRYIEESGTMNIWFRIGNKLVTPELSDSILDGITRRSIISLAKKRGIEVEERKILVEEILDAYHQNNLNECFGTGTAVTVSPIDSITFNSIRMVMAKKGESIALKLKKDLQDIQKGRIEDTFNWVTFLKEI